MPNIWTHILFCEEVVDAVPKLHPFSQHENYMKLGAQGPDPFFYYNFWPWVKEEPVHEVGTALHTEHCGTFLMELIENAKDSCNEVKAYVVGFITHHVLDRNTHPYIYYRAGYEESNHQLLETAIDTLMMEKYHNLKTWKTPVYKEIDLGRKLDSNIVFLLFHAINKFFPKFNSKNDAYIQKAYRDMLLALRLLADPTGIKNRLIGSLISAYSHQPIKDHIDYLNLNKLSWKHPATNELSDKSFIDLYNESRVEGIDIITEVQNYWNQGSQYSKQKLEKLIGNISYDTGTDLEQQLENKYSSPIF
ncbi:zinc dependent phospholipase C family protein [Oceanobacillus sp. FSL H7-0719]|uniref:zinc dependent phospholipase C family protein n=1 Tax=Oceanobacillus sp. FSL H7-0719 TaxID=2954507 RepID=UPI00324EBC69